MQAGLMAKLVLLCLHGGSIVSWTVIAMKHKALKLARKESQAFLNTFWYGQDLEEIFSKSEQLGRSPVANVFKAGFKELKKISQLESKSAQTKADGLANVARALNRATMAEIGSLEVAIGLLATVGSATPFVGLFGTVWGIMSSFQGIGATGSANLAVVRSGYLRGVDHYRGGPRCRDSRRHVLQPFHRQNQSARNRDGHVQPRLPEHRPALHDERPINQWR